MLISNFIILIFEEILNEALSTFSTPLMQSRMMQNYISCSKLHRNSPLALRNINYRTFRSKDIDERRGILCRPYLITVTIDLELFAV